MTLKEVCGMMICMGQLDDSTKIYVRDEEGKLLFAGYYHEAGIRAYLDAEAIRYSKTIKGALVVYVENEEGLKRVSIGETKYREIQVLTEDDELIASITAENVIEKDGYKVVCVPGE